MKVDVMNEVILVTNIDALKINKLSFRGRNSGEKYIRCHLLGRSAMWSVNEPAFRWNVSPPSSGSKISRARNQRASIYLATKRWFIYGLHGATSQKMATFLTSAVRTSYPKKRM
jgi:hypothetical protein